MTSSNDHNAQAIDLTATVTLSDEGDVFFLVLRNSGLDLTLAIDDPPAARLADFITRRLALRLIAPPEDDVSRPQRLRKSRRAR